MITLIILFDYDISNASVCFYERKSSLCYCKIIRNGKSFERDKQQQCAMYVNYYLSDNDFHTNITIYFLVHTTIRKSISITNAKEFYS